MLATVQSTCPASCPSYDPASIASVPKRAISCPGLISRPPLYCTGSRRFPFGRQLPSATQCYRPQIPERLNLHEHPRVVQVPGAGAAVVLSSPPSHRVRPFEHIVWSANRSPPAPSVGIIRAPCCRVHAASNQSLENRYGSRLVTALFITLELIGATERLILLLRGTSFRAALYLS